jgi:hypothetical protein
MCNESKVLRASREPATDSQGKSREGSPLGDPDRPLRPEDLTLCLAQRHSDVDSGRASRNKNFPAPHSIALRQGPLPR